jgi:hypothetical protein
MLTTKQKETIKKLNDGKLTSQEKADFYFRLSRIFKKNAESTAADMITVLNTVPESYLNKIDKNKLAFDTVELLKKLIDLLDLAQTYSSDSEDRPSIVYKRFRVEFDNPLPNFVLSQGAPTAVVTVSYQPSAEETALVDQLRGLAALIAARLNPQADCIGHLTKAEFTKKLEGLRNKPGLSVSMAPLGGR